MLWDEMEADARNRSTVIVESTLAKAGAETCTLCASEGEDSDHLSRSARKDFRHVARLHDFKRVLHDPPSALPSLGLAATSAG